MNARARHTFLNKYIICINAHIVKSHTEQFSIQSKRLNEIVYSDQSDRTIVNARFSLNGNIITVDCAERIILCPHLRV